MRIKLILLCVLLAVFTGISFATDYYRVSSDLNVRTGAGAGHSISFTLEKGDEVELLLKDKDWSKIKYLGKVGFVSSRYLKFSKTISDTKSDFTEQKVDGLVIVVYASIVLFVCFIVYKKIRNNGLLNSVTNRRRGTPSERDLVVKLLKCGFTEQNLFHDLYVEKRKGEFSQLDLVLVTQVGIIVFEVKDYGGWIYGDGGQSQWTKVMAYGKQKIYFYNPIRQNTKHITELQKHLVNFDKIPFYSIIVFYGDCEFKNINFVPSGTYIVKSKRVLEVVRNILRDNPPYFYEDKNEVIRVLRDSVTNGGISENQIKHIENINDMLGKHRIFD